MDNALPTQSNPPRAGGHLGFIGADLVYTRSAWRAIVGGVGVDSVQTELHARRTGSPRVV